VTVALDVGRIRVWSFWLIALGLFFAIGLLKYLILCVIR
jgi:hypothetical protein